jgi:hypothetical protein
VIPVFALALATCSDPLGPEELPCQKPAGLTAGITFAPVDLEEMRAALAHAAGPLAAAMGSEELTASLVKATEFASLTLADELPRTGCRIVRIAAAALAQLPDDPATLPDRDAIRLILALTANTLDAMDTQR